jgi:hypothetical protein
MNAEEDAIANFAYSQELAEKSNLESFEGT